jgi:hypothetical protein
MILKSARNQVIFYLYEFLQCIMTAKQMTLGKLHLSVRCLYRRFHSFLSEQIASSISWQETGSAFQPKASFVLKCNLI